MDTQSEWRCTVVPPCSSYNGMRLRQWIKDSYFNERIIVVQPDINVEIYEVWEPTPIPRTGNRNQVFDLFSYHPTLETALTAATFRLATK